jgi:hypothetical protein
VSTDAGTEDGEDADADAEDGSGEADEAEVADADRADDDDDDDKGADAAGAGADSVADTVAMTLPLLPPPPITCATKGTAAVTIVRHGCALAGCGSLISAKRTQRPWCAGAHCPCAEAASAASPSAGGGDESAQSACSADAAESKCKTTGGGFEKRHGKRHDKAASK